jgi:hypothetical protein
MAQSLSDSKASQKGAGNGANGSDVATWSTAQRAWSTLLVVVTLVLGLLCVLMLSCTLTQTRMSSIAFSGVNVSIWKLNDIRNQWDKLRHQIASQSEALAEAEKEKADAAVESSEFDLTYRPERTTLDAKLAPFIAKVREYDPPLAAALDKEGPVERLERIESQRDKLIGTHPELEAMIKEITDLGKSYKKTDAKRIRVRAEYEARTKIADAAEKRLGASQAASDNLFSGQLGVKAIDPPTRARIDNVLFELFSSGTVIRHILLVPPEIMTLFLVVLMGLLGSSLQLTHQLFVRKEAESGGVYSLRLCVGAITALVIFIVAKAGVPVIADASKLGGDAPINPYFVSFLAIISGLMSEKAIISVQTQAAKYFDSGATEMLRWARAEVRDAMTQSQRNPADVAKSLEISETVLEDWLSGDEPVPLAGQKLFAAVLNRPIRDLFSDIPPDGRPPRPTDPPPAPQEPPREGATDAGAPAGSATGSTTQPTS